MIPLTCAEIALATGGTLLEGTEPSVIVDNDVTIDSRQVAPGALFACLDGEHVDGHDFAAAAISAGARAVLAARPVAQPGVLVDDVTLALGSLAHDVSIRSAATVVGVTGSSGKTTTKDLLAQVLGSAAPTIAPAGSFNNELGLPLTICRITPATRWLVLEYSARAVGHIAQLCEIARPQIAAVLNVGSAHIGQFGSVEAIAMAKGELVEALPANGHAILNADDPRVAAMSARTPATVTTYGLSVDADVRLHNVEIDDSGRGSFEVETPSGAASIRLAAAGRHNVSNAAAVIAIGLRAGLALADIAHSLSSATILSAHRMAVTRTANGVTVIDDAYNANPESMYAGLDALASLRCARRWAVLGAMRELGPAGAELHSAVGAHAARVGIDRVITVGADAAPIAAGAREVEGWTGVADEVAGIVNALTLLDDLAEGDAVLVKASNSEQLWRVADDLIARLHRATAGVAR